MRTRGFTLVEMTVALVLAAIVGGFIAMFVATPVNAYFAQNRRSELAASGESAMRHLSNDIAAALPNSVRIATIGTRRIIEFIPIDDSSLYRNVPFGADQDLNVAAFETVFDLLRPINIAPNSRVVIGNRASATPAQSAYTAVGRVITPAGTAAFVAGPTPQIQLNPAFRFGNTSPGRRIYAVSTATQYHCDLATGTLNRYQGLPIATAVTVPATSGTVMATDVTACAFAFAAAPNPSSHGGIATIQMTISRVTQGNTDRMRIAHQVRVRNPA